MIILRCNKCKKEVVWTLNLDGKLPDDWLAHEGRDLCPNCTKNFEVFRSDLNELFEDRIKEYFS